MIDLEEEKKVLEEKQRKRNEKKIDNFISEIEFIPSPNFSSRQKRKIDMIVIHYTGSLRINGTVSWFQNPKSKVSAHYIIGRDGRTIQTVKDEKKAWHAGVSYWENEFFMNANSIGIELVGTESSDFTEYQYNSLFILCSYLIKKWNIPLNRIVGHEDISGNKVKEIILKNNLNYSGKTDPGSKFNWVKLISKLEEIVPEDKKILSEEPILELFENDSNEIFKPQKEMESGKDVHDGTFFGIFTDLIKSFINIFKRKD